MATKKTMGYFFIVLAIVWTLAMVGLLPKLIETMFGVFKIFSGEMDSYRIGYVLGAVLYWTVHISLTIAFWKYGRRWIKNNQTH